MARSDLSRVHQVHDLNNQINITLPYPFSIERHSLSDERELKLGDFHFTECISIKCSVCILAGSGCTSSSR